MWEKMGGVTEGIKRGNEGRREKWDWWAGNTSLGQNEKLPGSYEGDPS